MKQQIQIFIATMIFTITAFCASVQAQETVDLQGDNPPCLQAEHKTLGYLEGNWFVESKQRVDFTGNQWEESVGKSIWTPIIGGCVFQEEWSGTIDGKELEWIQILSFDNREEKWELAMVDSAHGNLITSEGHREENKLVFYSPQMRKGKLLIDKTTFEKIDDNHFLWFLETSLDGGQSWLKFWEMKYSKQK
ncbi:DUF1579 family protein [Galbibacter sp. EGI 63066]|uniref:DUF1579 family protein n=1 Tax=Galbibacter sp. EGI 63066 TaxID=2993559 RepID=UPI002249629E|nr:DUF1579 family protein [Galbibacter sp. EGI 63066]MCX2679805.1 DUF1579 family protein [Galbibacter sp. EGI 63066]